MSKGNKPFSHKTVSFFHNKASKTSPVLLAPPFYSLNKKQSIKGMVNVQNVFKPLQKLQKNSGKP